MKKKARQRSKTSALRKTYGFLKELSEQPLPVRKYALKRTNGNPLIYKSLREMAYNVMKGNVKIDKKKLKPSHMKYLKEITKPENITSLCPCKKRKKLVQEGAGILSLLIPAVTTLASLFLRK